MDMSEDWKSYVPIRSVHFPPLLLSEQSTIKSSLGPLLFSPSPGTQRTEFSSPCIHFKSDDFSTMSNNNLGFLKCPDNDMLVFFPNGDNLHRLGFVKLSLKVDEKPAIDTASDCEFESGGIAKIMVTSASAVSAVELLTYKIMVTSVTLGLFLACTTSSTHWFRIDCINSPSLSFMLVGIRIWRKTVFFC
ncbi:hypothetical protein MKW92_005331 [Papaver armeniacum]|nr:hypothetical protein MKW92_005331 [Papaver armeniacum]